MNNTVTTGLLEPEGSRDDIKRAALRMLTEWTTEGEEPNRGLLRRVAQAAGVTPPTVKRWWQDRDVVPTPRESGYIANDHAVKLLFAAEGVLAHACEQLKEDSDFPFDVRTFERGIHRRLNSAQFAAASFGMDGFKALSLTITNPDGELHRNQIWEVDTVELPFRVVPLRGSRPQKCRVVALIDGATRYVPPPVLVVGRPVNRGDVLAALASAIHHDPERGPFHGAPRALRCDNGLDYLSRAVVEAVLAVGATLAPTAPYTPEHKGKIERWFRTFQERLSLDVPGSVEGARDNRGKLYDTNDLFSVGELAAAITKVVDAYNDRKHSALNGRSPREAWEDDPTPIRVIPDEDLRWMLLAAGQRKVVRQGIRFENRWFLAPELTGLVGETVEVRYLPSDLRTIEVYRRGKHLCTAVDVKRASNEFKLAIVRIRDHQAKTI